MTKSFILSAVALLTAGSVFAGVPAARKPVVRPAKPTERTRTADEIARRNGNPKEVKPTDEVKVRETVKSIGGEKSLIGRSAAENRVAELASKTDLSVATKADLVDALQNPETSGAFRQLEDYIRSRDRIDMAEKDLIETAAEWLAIAKSESDLVDIHVVFERALKGNFEPGVTRVLKEALKIKKDNPGKTLREATLMAMEKFGIKEDQVRRCT